MLTILHVVEVELKKVDDQRYRYRNGKKHEHIFTDYYKINTVYCFDCCSSL